MPSRQQHSAQSGNLWHLARRNQCGQEDDMPAAGHQLRYNCQLPAAAILPKPQQQAGAAAALGRLSTAAWQRRAAPRSRTKPAACDAKAVPAPLPSPMKCASPASTGC